MLIILKLLFVHLVFDFLLQPLAWVVERQMKKIRSTKVILHAFLHGFFAWAILWDVKLWWAGLLIFILHWAIDVWKSYQKSTLKSFLTDQALHLLTIILVAVLIQWPELHGRFSPEMHTANVLYKALPLGIGIILLLRPTSMVVKYFMQKFELEQPDTYALENAGQWIGYFERIIILLSVLMGAYTVLGFLVASKSLLRFGDKENQSRKHTEYVLLGSLLSWGVGLFVGIGVAFLMAQSFIF